MERDKLSPNPKGGRYTETKLLDDRKIHLKCTCPSYERLYLSVIARGGVCIERIFALLSNSRLIIKAFRRYTSLKLILRY